MLLQGQCQHCGGIYEYEAGIKSEFCPHCGRETFCPPPKRDIKSLGRPRIPVPLLVVSVACIFFFSTTVFLWNRDASLKKAILQLQSENAQLESDLASAKARTISALQNGIDRNQKQIAAIEQKDMVAAVCGIYEFEPPYAGITKVHELRSDGTSVNWWYSGNNFNNKMQQGNSRWTLQDGVVFLDRENFRIEGNDLIDRQGNRWLRTR